MGPNVLACAETCGVGKKTTASPGATLSMVYLTVKPGYATNLTAVFPMTC